MNIYVIVEGEKAAKKIYQKWITLVNPNLRSVDYLTDFTHNNFLVYHGLGQPIWGRVSKAVEDVVNTKNIDRLVIAFDSEDKSYNEKLEEAKDQVEKLGCPVEVKYVVQHFCLETWLLGNRDIFRKKPQNNLLREYYVKFDIRVEDPENLPDHPKKAMNRAQFAYNYLRLGISDIHGEEKWYNKRNPGIALEEQYFRKIKQRYENINHIKSFRDFINAFQ